jgi:hypothetical protein
MSLSFYWATWHYIPEDCTLHSHQYGNLRSNISVHFIVRRAWTENVFSSSSLRLVLSSFEVVWMCVCCVCIFFVSLHHFLPFLCVCVCVGWRCIYMSEILVVGHIPLVLSCPHTSTRAGLKGEWLLSSGPPCNRYNPLILLRHLIL